ncbi:CHAP domain-containing protein [Fodinicola acaciae]|uniref:CHAP domain-containing protein n=1 Tax=Fodinicola acaciae TaxID=2681555 RepID=UPI0013D38AAF|nr:CHAP domain-containing protein [Fodinicola acaciae]
MLMSATGRRAAGVAIAVLLLAGLASPVAAQSPPTATIQAATRAAIVAKAASQVGYAGDGNQCTKYTSVCADWCAAFTNWVWSQSGVSPVPTTLVARGVGLWGVNHGLFKPRNGGFGDPRPGDVVVYGPPDGQVGGHVSIVESVGNGVITTINGNYNNRVVRTTINPLTARAGAQNVLISGYVTPPGVVDSPPPTKHVDGDVSGDGSADLLATKTDGSLIYCPNNAAVNPDHLPFMDCVTTGGGWQNATKVVEGDVSGDGSVDIVAAKSDGSLIYCPNNAAVNPDHLPFMDCAVTGSGWGSTVTHMFLGDVSGDGSADLLATKTDGSLIYCPNNAAINPGHLPFMDCVTTGGGWDPAHVTNIAVGDVSGDGSVDILATKTDGTLIYCPNNGAINPDHLPFMDCVTTGSGWSDTTQIFAADVSGDGSADLLAIKGDGTLVYCPNNAAVNPGHLPFMDCANTGSGWQPSNATHVLAVDVSGDGSVDLLASKADGSLIYCPNNAATNPGHAPFVSCVTTGNGWQPSLVSRLVANAS